MTLEEPVNQIELVVFDLAGTTVEDDGAVLSSLVEAARAHGLDDSADELNGLMGMSKGEVFTMLAERAHPLDASRSALVADEALQSFLDSMRAQYERSLTPVPGAEDTLRFLRSRNVKIAIDTGFDHVITSLIMRRLDWPGRLVDTVVCSSDVQRGRPAPYMIFHAMERLGVLCTRQVMKVGDSPADLAEGMNARCGEVIGVLSGAHTVATLGPLPHTRLLNSVAEIPMLFEQAADNRVGDRRAAG